MEALLGGAKRNPSFDSVDDLLQQFRESFELKVSPAKAEHVSTTYEFRTNVSFYLSVSESEHDALESAARLNSSLGGSTFQGQSPSGDQYLHQVKSNNAIIHQPHDDPILQRAIAKHIVNALGQVDGSTWTVRSVSRAAQGWTFIYTCKDSMQSWLRSQGKAQRPVVGESSGKDGQDPINLARPAFDCRGSVTISFHRSNRSISVKYDHTPFHKTVSQLVEIFAPVPEPISNKRKADTRQDGEGQPKKRRRKKNTDIADADGEAGAGGTPNGTPNGKPRRKRATGTPRKRKVTGAGDGQADGTPSNATSGSVSAGAQGLLNLPPGEAQRRKTVAENILSAADIPPDTLSADQLNIFSNQSPELQRESLAMLAKYGAERLRIVHPNKDANSASASPAPAIQSGSDTPTSSAKKRSRKKMSEAIAIDSDEDSAAATSSAKKSQKPRLTRGKCEGCKARKVQCSKEKPSCSQCQEVGNSCYYAPAVSRASKAFEDEEGEQQEEEQQEEEVEEEEPDDLPSPGFSQPIPQPQISSPPLEDHDAFGQATADWNQPNSLSFPQPLNHDVSQQTVVSASGMGYTQVHPQNLQRLPALSDSSLAHPTQEPDAMQYSGQAPSTTHQSPSARTRSNRRQSLSRGQQSEIQNNSLAMPTSDAASSAWKSLPHAVSTSANANPASPAMGFGSRSPKQSGSRRSTSKATAESQNAFDGLQQAAALSRAALQQPSQRTPPSQRSPFEPPAQPSRSKSRLSQRGQTRTPVPNQPSVAPQASTHHASETPAYGTSASTDSSAVPSYDSYSRYLSNTRDQSSSGGAYESYSSTTAPHTSTSYPSYDSYNTRSSNNSTSYTNPVTQSMSTSYTTASTPASQWPTSQPQNTYSYNTNTSTTSSYNMPSTSTQPSQSLSSFNVRPQPTGAQTRRSGDSSYDRQPQQQQQQSYGSYSSQPNTSSNSQQQNWYGFTPANNTASGYNTRSSSGTGGYNSSHSGNSTSYNRQHGSASQPRSSYNLNTGDQALYDLLQNNHGS